MEPYVCIRMRDGCIGCIRMHMDAYYRYQVLGVQCIHNYVHTYILCVLCILWSMYVLYLLDILYILYMLYILYIPYTLYKPYPALPYLTIPYRTIPYLTVTYHTVQRTAQTTGTGNGKGRISNQYNSPTPPPNPLIAIGCIKCELENTICCWWRFEMYWCPKILLQLNSLATSVLLFNSDALFCKNDRC